LIKTNPKKLPHQIDIKITKRNISTIQSILGKIKSKETIAAWGNTIYHRDFLMDCLEMLINKTAHLNLKWQSIGPLTIQGHPWHPLYVLKKNKKRKALNIKKYLKTHRKRLKR